MNRQRWWVQTAVVLGAAILFMAIAAWQSQPWWEYAFLSDDSPVSWLSSALLLANAAVALKLTLDGSLGRLFGAVLALLLAALALDEQFMLHEWFKYTYADPASPERLLPAIVGDLPTLLVGAGGVVLLFGFARVVGSKPARGLMTAAVVLGLFALWVDLGAAPVWLTRTEEAYEVMAESLLLCALLALPPAQVHSSS
jgi:hypothetical protein